MVIPHIVVLVAASLAVLGPCAVVVARADGSARRRAWLLRERRNRPALRRLDRAVRDNALPGPPAGLTGEPSLRQVQAELRRLNAQRHGGTTGGSRLWTDAVERAYDRWLQLACRYLSVTAHLPVTGDALDRDLERLRVEEKLADAGLRIRRDHRPPA